MFRRFSERFATRSGLTLLELVVVMAILAGLAGILVPLMPGMVGKASSSSGATNLSETVKAVQLYACQNNDQYPDNLDSIVDTSGVITGYVPNVAIGGSGTSSSSLQLTPYPLTQNDLAALNAAGIAHVAQMISAQTMQSDLGAYGSATFYSDGFSLTSVALAQGGKVAGVAGTVAAQKFGVPATGTYIVFGLGPYASIIGNTITKAPVWINPAAGYDPNTMYSRLGLVFQTANANGPLARAVFVGAVQFSDTGLLTQDEDMSKYSAQ
jgi:prepilin-type N-terminal cleavage/methylation domain-containing protein